VTERAALLTEGPVIDEAHILLEPEPAPFEDVVEPLPYDEIEAPTGVFNAPAPNVRVGNRDDERLRILRALELCGGNQTRAAESLNVSRRTLINRMIEFGLPRPRKN
jgi:DNA-binding NtrC family response regulator